MPSIEKRGKNTWRLTVELGFHPDGRRWRERKTVVVEDGKLLKSEKKLKEYLESEWYKFRDEVLSGRYVKPENLTFKAFVEQHWRPKYAENPDNLARSTLEVYNQHLQKHILPWFGPMALRDIRPMHIVDFIAYLRTPAARKDGKPEPLQPGTQLVILRALRNVLTRAVEWRLIPENPFVGARPPKVVKKKLSVYNKEEIRQLMVALDRAPVVWRLLILGALLGGFRRGELVALEISDCDFDAGTIFVDESIPMKIDRQHLIKSPKTEHSKRIVRMPKWYMEELKEYALKTWKRQRWEAGEKWQAPEGRQFLFHAGKGLPFHPNHVTKWWREFLRKNGLRPIRLHGLRHTLATHLLESGLSPRAVAELLGHADERTLLSVYSHVTKEMEDRTLAERERLVPILSPRTDA